PDRLVLETSPFYAESGGQVGDRGTIAAKDGAFRFRVEDTQKVGEVVVHLGELEGRRPEKGAEVETEVDLAQRDRTKKHHTATHLLHKALRDLLGDHVTQQGSYVGPDRLRFDFSNPKGLEAEQIEAIENQVNAQILRNSPVVSTEEELDAAKERGVMALFGEKYADRVRVVDVGGWSTELCGGTHVSAAGDIGPFLILSERAIQAGVRRIEAVAGEAALQEIQRQRRLLQDAGRALKASPDEVPDRVAQLQKQVKEAKKQKSAAAGADVDAAFAKASEAISEAGDLAFGAFRFPTLDAKALGDLGSRLHGKHQNLAIGLLGGADGKVPFLILCEGSAQ
ncbi:MAG: alanine--tRNA ligase-related protein, partial [Planctomycetota bacterium]